jgi:RNA polymerase sigma factor (sigma-70 family)
VYGVIGGARFSVSRGVDVLPCAPTMADVTLTFDRLLWLLEQPPHEPCESELRLITDEEYDEAFSEAQRLYRRPVVGYLAHLVRDYDKATDLAQEVFMNVYRARSSLERAYIYRAAKNTALSALRRSQRRGILESRWAGVRRYGDTGARKVKRSAPSLEYLERTREEAVRRAIQGLLEKFRVPLLLHAEGMSYGQIAEVTGVREEVIASRICVAKSLLRRRLRAYLNGVMQEQA